MHLFLPPYSSQPPVYLKNSLSGNMSPQFHSIRRLFNHSVAENDVAHEANMTWYMTTFENTRKQTESAIRQRYDAKQLC